MLHYQYSWLSTCSDPRCKEAVMDCMSSLQRRVDEDKAELLNRLEEMCSENLVGQVCLFLLKIQYRRRMERKM